MLRGDVQAGIAGYLNHAVAGHAEHFVVYLALVGESGASIPSAIEALPPAAKLVFARWCFGEGRFDLGVIAFKGALADSSVLVEEADFVEMLLRFPVSSGATQAPGFGAMATQTARLLLIHVVRTFALARDGGQGWLYALSDAGLSRALACIHRQPAQDWSVAALAQAAGMSRSAFAKRFHDTLGQSPMRYLCDWRIHLAREALASGRSSITTVAHDVGYSSEAAFRAAFRRATGQQPRAYRRSASRAGPQNGPPEAGR